MLTVVQTVVESPRCRDCFTQMHFDEGDESTGTEALHYCPECGNNLAIGDSDIIVQSTEDDARPHSSIADLFDE